MKNSLRLKILEALVERLNGECSKSLKTCPREIERKINECDIERHSYLNDNDELTESISGEMCDCEWIHRDCVELLSEIRYSFYPRTICPCLSNLEFEDILRVLLKEINRLKENGDEQER